MLRMDQAYDGFVAALRGALKEIEAAMLVSQVHTIALGGGIPKRPRGVNSGVVYVKALLQNGKLVMQDKDGGIHQIVEMDSEAMHLVICRIRGSAIGQRLCA